MAISLATVALLAQTGVHAQSRAVDRIEPPNWWVGMKNDRVQLMVHGPKISDSKPGIDHPGVKIEAVKRTANANYLFIDLRIAPSAKPGSLKLTFTHGDAVYKVPYELLAREIGSAQRVGFNTSDAILNLMPDRFANGKPDNDNLPGFEDKVNRADTDSGRHGGDIQGIINHLDYIAAMGYTAIWPTPLTESNQPRYSYHGYAVTDTYRIDPRYGSNDDYKRMVTLAREKGIGVIKDIVLNHVGSNHWWMKDMPAPDWLSFDGRFVPTYHARTAVSDPYAAAIDRNNFTAGWFEKNMPDMNQRNPLLATYQIQNTLWWIEFAGLAGIRADTYSYSDAAFITEWSRRVMEEYPRLNIVGEEWSYNPVVISYWLRGRTQTDGYVSHLPSVMDFPLHEVLRKSLVEPDSLHSGLADLYEALVNDRLYPDPANLVLFEGNHDVARLFSILDEDPALYRMALVYVLTMRRIPQLYYGTEILMTSPKKRDDGAFRLDFPGGWPGDRVNAFTGEGLTAAQKDAQAFLRKLLNWRKTQTVIHHGKLKHFAPQDGTYVYFRYDKTDKVMVVFNKNSKEQTLETARFKEVLGSAAAALDVISGRRFELREKLTVPARSVLVLQVDR
jgi:neopullulanase